MFDWCPRPERDNGIGLHDDGNSGDGPGTMGFMHNLIDAMADVGFSWLKIITDVNEKSGRLALLEHARNKGIMPIVRPFRQPCHPWGLDLYDDYIKAVVAYTPYIEIGNEPNLASVECWKPYPQYTYGNVTGRAAFISLLYDQWCSEGEKVRRLGGIPLFPALSPTAYNSADVYFHHDLYTEIIGLGKLRGNLNWAFDHAGIAIHNRPSDNPLDAVDRCAFKDYEWIESQFKATLGKEIPLFGTEAGYEDGMVGSYILHQLGNLYPNNDDFIKWHKLLNHEMFARFNPGHPKAWADYLICECAWLAADDGWYASGWARNARVGGGALPSFTDMDQISRFTRAEGAPYIPPEEEEEQPVPEPQPVGDIEFVRLSQDMIASLSVSGPADPTQPYWKVCTVEVQPDRDNMSLWVVVPKQAQPPVMFWEGGEAPMNWKDPDAYAPPGARNGAYEQPMHHCWGNFGVRMSGNSEALFGFGLYGPGLELTYTAHRPVLVYYRLVPGASPEPPISPPEPPQPPIEPDVPYEFGSALSKRLVASGLARMVDMRDAIEKKYARLADCGVRSVDADKREDGFWSITFHHDQITYPLDVMAIAREHTAVRGWTHIGYHFILDRAGTVWWTKRLRYYGPHSGNSRFNKYSIAVTAHGDFTVESPSEAQLKALKCVTDTLEEWVGEAQGHPQPLPIVRHKDIVNTECPGNLYEKYRQYVDGAS